MNGINTPKKVFIKIYNANEIIYVVKEKVESKISSTNSLGFLIIKKFV